MAAFEAPSREEKSGLGRLRPACAVSPNHESLGTTGFERASIDKPTRADKRRNSGAIFFPVDALVETRLRPSMGCVARVVHGLSRSCRAIANQKPRESGFVGAVRPATSVLPDATKSPRLEGPRSRRLDLRVTASLSAEARRRARLEPAGRLPRSCHRGSRVG